MEKRVIIIFITLMVFLFSTSWAQWDIMPRPNDAWETVETDHFHIHYTPEVKQWTMQLVPILESIHSAVTQTVGYYHIDEYLDVFIIDPMGVANGMAIPVKTRPRIILWPDAPVDPMMLGGLETWHEIVMVHEYTHAVHLSRRSQSIQSKIIRKLLPVGSMSFKLPMWVTEGFAVIVESRLTGYGREQSSLRSMLLTQLAVEGKLPDYGSLNGNDQWLGGRYPYLIGSAFLDWLQKKHAHPDCLLHLWKRASAKKARSFEEAFSGVFQDSPQDLYDRFRAELTVEALALESQLAQVGISEGAPWQVIDGMTGQPAVSPDGKSMAVVVRKWKEQPNLHIWSTQEEVEKKDEPDDPDDVVALPCEPPARKELYRFSNRHGISPNAPRWMPDGKSLLFHGFRRRPNDDLRTDIFRWWPEDDRLTRITTGKAVAWADPSPDGRSAVCLYQEYGYSGIMIVDLETGELTPLKKAALQPVWQSPRFAPDGKSIVVIGRENHRSELFTIELATETVDRLVSNDREVILAPVWSPDGTEVFYCSDGNGTMNIRALELETANNRYVTRSLAGVLYPEISPDTGTLYFIKPHAKGMDIHHSQADATYAETNFKQEFTTVQPPGSVTLPELFESKDQLTVKPYSICDNIEYGLAVSGNSLPYQHSVEGGMWAGDILGRLRVLATGGYGVDGGPSGGSLGCQYKGLPMDIRFKLFHVDRDSSQQTMTMEEGPLDSDWSVLGGDLELIWERKFSNGGVECLGGGAFGTLEMDDNGLEVDRYLGGVSLRFNGYDNYSRFKFGGSGVISGYGGVTDDVEWFQYCGEVGLSIGWSDSSIRCDYSYGETSGDFSLMDKFGSMGYLSSIESSWFNKNRVLVPWLPDGTLRGEKYEQITVECVFGGLSPLTFFGTELNMWDDDKPDPQRVVGTKLAFEIPTLALVRIDACDFEAGVVYGIDGLIEEKWRGYVTFRLFP